MLRCLKTKHLVFLFLKKSKTGQGPKELSGPMDENIKDHGRMGSITDGGSILLIMENLHKDI